MRWKIAAYTEADSDFEEEFGTNQQTADVIDDPANSIFGDLLLDTVHELNRLERDSHSTTHSHESETKAASAASLTIYPPHPISQVTTPSS